METDTISSYEKKSTEQLGLEKNTDFQKKSNHLDTTENHLNNGTGTESAHDKDDLDDSRSDEEEEDVPLIVQGSKSDEEHSDDELSHLDLHNDDDDEEEDIESEQKIASTCEKNDQVVESSSQNQNDADKLNSAKEEQEKSNSCVNGPNESKEPAIKADSEGTSHEANGKNGSPVEILSKIDETSDNIEINKSDTGHNEKIEKTKDSLEEDEIPKENPCDVQHSVTDKNEDDDSPVTKQLSDIQNTSDKLDIDNGNELLEATATEQSTNNNNEHTELECGENEKNSLEKNNVTKSEENKTGGPEKAESMDVVEGEHVNDNGNNKYKNKECDKGEVTEIVNKDGKHKEADGDKQGDKDKQCDKDKQNNEVESGEKEKDNEKVESSNEGEEKNSLLKQTLSRPSDYKEPDGEEDIDMDDDFDPSLLCPDIAMEVDEAPVITSNTEPPASDAPGSSLLYEPMFSTAVDEFTGAEASIQLTPEEENLRIETFANSPVQFTKIHCTACNVHLGSALDGQGNRFVHPLLKVLICKNCYHFYTSGEFEKDEDGSELYCRWCGQGGQVMCCSNCEMVFCRKCIRINFDRKTIAQIRDSEDWVCFRCNPSQITYLKVHCAEFMEYVRRETSRASTLDNAVEFMKVDHSRCCSAPKKKAPESNEVPKKKKRKSSYDPDFDPHKQCESPKPSTSGTPKTELITIASKPTDPNKNGDVIKVSTPSVITVTPTTSNATPYKPRPYSPRSRVQLVNTNSAQNPRPTNSSGPGYIKIAPRAPNSVSPSTRNRAPTILRPAISNNKPPGTTMKHEWFERTVISAARVNSNLSYTLTQLNRAQANATSVELLAVVHNKLQEILSSSINSLIAIRKKLRLEFIEGIKNTRFPSTNKPQPIASKSTTNNNSADDDDVIFVDNSTSTPTASTSSSTNNKTSNSVTVMSNPPPLAPLKKTANERSNSPGMSVKVIGNNGQPKSFLRVKSLNALLNVTSECITIPDDAPPTVLKPADSSTSQAAEEEDDDDVKIIEKPIEQVDLTDSEHEEVLFNLTNEPTVELNRMQNVYVSVERSLMLEKMIKQKCDNNKDDGISHSDGNSKVDEGSHNDESSKDDGSSHNDENSNANFSKGDVAE